MKYYVDFEFLQDGRTIEMISVGIVAEDGREYYAVSSEMPWSRIVQNEWLLDNVVTSLPLKFEWAVPLLEFNDPSVKSRIDIRREIMTFFRAGGSSIELWGWYSGFDYVVLSQLFGTMTDTPSGIPHWINDLRQEVERLGIYSSLPEQPAEGYHNALEDAKFLKVRHEYVQQWERARDDAIEADLLAQEQAQG